MEFCTENIGKCFLINKYYYHAKKIVKTNTGYQLYGTKLCLSKKDSYILEDVLINFNTNKCKNISYIEYKDILKRIKYIYYVSHQTLYPLVDQLGKRDRFYIRDHPDLIREGNLQKILNEVEYIYLAYYYSNDGNDKHSRITIFKLDLSKSHYFKDFFGSGLSNHAISCESYSFYSRNHWEPYKKRKFFSNYGMGHNYYYGKKELFIENTIYKIPKTSKLRDKFDISLNVIDGFHIITEAEYNTFRNIILSIRSQTILNPYLED